MKKTYTLLIALMMTCLGYGQTTIYTQDFELADTGYLSSNTEGSTFEGVFNRIDASAATGGNIGGNSTFIWAVEDSNETPGSINLSQIDVTGYTDFTFSLDMLAHHFEDWDSTDELLISYSLDSGASQNLLWVQMVPTDNFNGPAAIDTDFDGGGDCGVATTLPALTTGTQHGCTVSASDFATFSSAVIPLNGNSTLDITLEFNGMTSGDEGIYLDNISVEANDDGAGPSTAIQFNSTSDTVGENVGTYDLVVEIVNEDAAATTFDLALISGDAADINGYTTQSETFPGSSTTDVTVTITVTDDATFEPDETLTFEIQNVAGGSSAAVGMNSTFDLTITNNDPPATIALPYSEDFTDCNTAQWLPFSESGSNSWSCASGEYTMNGFPNPDDVDWLISNFSIDFELTTNENIAVTTSERFGDDVNDPGEFELRYSNDYPGFGDPTVWTWTALTFDPNNTSTGPTPSADSVTIVDATSISGTAYLAFFYDMTAGSGAEEWNVTEIVVQEGALDTEVSFLTDTATIDENIGTFDLEFTIANPDAVAATSFDVVLVGGSAVDLDNYTTQTVNFPAGSSANETVTLTITDDMIEEVNEGFSFQIQNITGGNNTVVGTFGTFFLTISENDQAGLLYDADFSNDGDGFPEHSSVSPPAPGPTSVGPFGTAPNQWSLSYDTAPNTDGGGNTFETSGGQLESRDWGGQGIFTSQVIDVSSIDVVDISAQGFNVNANDDVFVYFYILDGGTRVETDLGITNNGDPINYAVSGLNVSGATSLEVGFEFSENGSGSGYDVSEFTVIEGVAETSVQFDDPDDSILEDGGTYNLTFQIEFEDPLNDTTFDVVLTSGDPADIDGYTTQTVTFPAGTSAEQQVVVTITDDALVESFLETFTFEIQNVMGGNNAAVGVNSSFDLTIQDNDGTQPVPGDIVISEIMYNSSGADDEWIEIYNASGADITLDSDWQLSYGNGPTTFDFAGTVITAGSYITIAIGSDGVAPYNVDNPFTPDVSIFSLPADAGTTGNTNQLVNSSTTIALTYEPSGSNVTIDAVTYDDGAPWPTAADGNGPSLELIDVSFDNALAASWVASGNYDGGTPGAQYVAPVVYTFNGTWSPSNPNGTATATDDIVIASGDAIIDTNTTCNSVIVNAGAGLTINTGITLTSSNGLTLESTSTSYSSLLGDGAVTGTIEYERFTNSNANGNDLISAPLGGQTWTEFIGDFPNFLNLFDDGGSPVTTYAFGPFSKTAGTFVNYDENSVADLTSGVGYRAATDSGDVLVFTGTPVTNGVSVTVGNGGPNNEEWNLIGNPYASYLDAASFLAANAGVFEPGTFGIWGYDGNAANGWTLVNLANVIGNPLVAPGQGFFISCSATSNTINYDPSWRSSGASDDYISGRFAQLQYMVLNIDSGDKSFHTDFYFNPLASEGFDLGYDTELWDEVADDFRIYSHLAQDNNGEAIALQTMNIESINEVTIPLGVHANQGEQFTFSITESTLPDDLNVYLDDVVANTTTLLNTTDYVITPNSNLSGTGRFFLRYAEDALSTVENDIEGLNIFALNSSKEIVVSGQLLEAANLELYDMQGRAVFSEALDSKNLENRINVSSLSAGVYIASVQNNGTQKTQKVILK